jgi:hypothetical protein
MSDAARAALFRYLDGTELLAKTQALRLSTVGPDGWPHLSLLSAGDMLAVSSGRLRFALHATSGTARNLERDGRLTVTAALDGGLAELRLRAGPIGPVPPDMPLVFFEAEVETVRTHVAPYARVTAGITFALHDPEAVLGRWRRQIEALCAASRPA